MRKIEKHIFDKGDRPPSIFGSSFVTLFAEVLPSLEINLDKVVK